MKLIFLMLVLIPQLSYGQDCIDKMINLAKILKLKGHISHALYGDDRKPNAPGACDSSHETIKEIESDTRHKKKYGDFLKNRLSSKGVLEPEYLQDLLYDSNAVKPLNRQEVCKKLDAEFKKQLEQECLSSDLENFAKNFNPGTSIVEACKKMLPMIQKNRGSCDELASPASFQREPPGEEISPDVPVLAAPRPKPVQNPTAAPASINFKSSNRSKSSAQ